MSRDGGAAASDVMNRSSRILPPVGYKPTVKIFIVAEHVMFIGIADVDPVIVGNLVKDQENRAI
jgi:hypothetical protein